MKKKRWRTLALIILVVLLLIPIRIGLRDGGTFIYQAALYRLTRYHSLVPIEQHDQYSSGFYEATAISVFPFYFWGLELTL